MSIEHELSALTKGFVRRREMLVTAVIVPFAVYFVAVTTAIGGTQLKVVLALAAVVVLVTRVAGLAWVRAHVSGVAALASQGDPASLRRAKAGLVRVPRLDALVAGMRWAVGIPLVAFGTWLFSDLSGLQLVAIAMVPVMVVPYAMFLAYLIAENGLASALAGPVFGPVRLSREERVGLSENTRRVLLAVAVATLPVVALGFLFALSALGLAQFTQLGAHLAGIAAFTAVALAIVIRESSRGTSRSVEELVGSLDAVARGDFSSARGSGVGTSELGYVAQSIDVLAGTVERLLGELARMSREHEAGDLDAALSEEEFEGAYREIARGIVAMVGSHVSMNRSAMDTFAQLARGDFDATMPPLPGKKRFVNETLDQVRESLRGLVAELTRMTAAQAAGDVDAVIDAARFRGGFRAIAEGMNGMAADQLALTRKLLACVDRFGKGDFEAPLEPFPGKKAMVNETVEQVRTRLKSLIADADRLSRAAVEGRFDVRADAARHEGDYRRIVQGVNDTLDAILAPVRDIAAMLDTLAAGNLSSRLDPGRYREDARALAERVNGTVGALLAPVDEATQVLETLARRDLSARMRGDYRGDHARMKEAVNATGASLHAAVQQVSAAAAQVSSAAAQIAASSQAVAGGASQQATALAETTSTVEGVATMTRQATDNAREASTLAHAARAAAREGEAAMERLQGAMVDIRKGAESTSQIIRDVSDIAFQTNLLALNAAVEAARAGEAGRGFAVVAEEVRSLALRAKDAAQKTESLIRESVKLAGQGEDASGDASGKLREILAGVGKVSELVSEVATTSQEQSAGILRVRDSVAEVEKVTQQNAASAEESSAAASEMNAQAEELSSMVAAFRLEQQEVVQRVLAARAARTGTATLRTPAADPTHSRRSGAPAGSAARAGRKRDPFPMDGGSEPIPDF